MNEMRRMMMRCVACCCVALIVLSGCGDTESDGPETSTGDLTKEDAARLGGKSDHGIDLCDFYDWYGDGICDTFCAQPDPDCDTSYDPCAGLACGESCTLCDPADPDCFETAVVKQCQSDGTCSADVAQCSDPDPDPDPDYDPCEGLACGDTCTLCDPADPDCYETAVVKLCQSDGTCAAEVPQCSDPDPDPDYDPCDGKTCGDSCTICDPADPNCVETAVLKVCQADGTCSATQPQCNAPAECTTDADCVVTGCSGQVCASDHLFTTCEWREEYACYQDYGNCGCNNGTCGWAQTDELNSCLGN